MINIERGLGRIGVVLLSFGVGLLLTIFAWIAAHGTPDGPTILRVVFIYGFGILFLIILLWQVFRWVLRGFHSR